MVTNNYDVSCYTDGKVYGEEDIIELACALVRINRLHEIGEVAFSSDELFEAGQLSIIRQIIEGSNETDSSEDSWMKLYQKLQELNGS